MPLSRTVARLNRVGLNRVARPIAARLAPFGVVVHRGRRSGREYRTPVNVFRTDGGLVVALTYGPDADWVRNVLAAGGCVVENRGRPTRYGQPRVVRDETLHHMPAVVRPILRAVGVVDFLELVAEPPGR